MIELIPAIDIIEGRCVRLTKGDYGQKTVYGDPLQMAREFEKSGVRRLHVVDLDGAKAQHVVNIEVLRRITEQTSLVVDFGGGIKTDEDIRQVFEAGASMVTIGSVAVRNPELFFTWLERYGTDRIILGADVRHGKVSIGGWLEDTSLDVLSFLKSYFDRGVRRVLCTDISRDGTLEGPSIELYETIRKACPGLRLIASGGVSTMKDIHRLEQAGVQDVVFGKAFYEGRITLQELQQYSATNRRKLSPSGTGLAKRIIPCLDVKNGETVKGINFVDLRSAGDPVELGKAYSEQGADELVFLDITASYEGRKTFTDMVTRVAREINIPFTVGGGINELADVERMLSAGADKVSINSAALRRPELVDEIVRRFGSQVCVVAIDARLDSPADAVTAQWHCYLKGGRERTERKLFEWAHEVQDRGAGEILFTSMNHDGTKQGFANEALARLTDDLSIPVIASGGAGLREHFRDVFAIGHADAALAASVFHYGEMLIPELKQYLRNEGINVRL